MEAAYATYNSRSGYRQRTGATMLSAGLASSVALLLGVYWLIYAFNVDAAVKILRPAVLGASLLLALIWIEPALTRAELRLSGILAIMCTVLLAPSMAATDPMRALSDWLKIVILCLV